MWCLRLDFKDHSAEAGFRATLCRRALKVSLRVLNDAVVGPLPIGSVKGVQHGVLTRWIDLEDYPATRRVINLGAQATEISAEPRRAVDVSRLVHDHWSPQTIPLGPTGEVVHDGRLARWSQFEYGATA